MGRKSAMRWMFGSKRRHDLWLRCKYLAQDAGRGDLPICPHCDLPVAKTDDWHACHVGRARSNGGKCVRVGHAACNLKDARQVVVPNNAKADRQRAFHEGRRGPGLGRCPMRAGRRSKETKTFRHGVVRRRSLSEKLAETLARRAIGGGGLDRSVPPVALPDFPFSASLAPACGGGSGWGQPGGAQP